MQELVAPPVTRFELRLKRQLLGFLLYDLTRDRVARLYLFLKPVAQKLLQSLLQNSDLRARPRRFFSLFGVCLLLRRLGLSLVLDFGIGVIGFVRLLLFHLAFLSLIFLTPACCLTLIVLSTRCCSGSAVTDVFAFLFLGALVVYFDQFYGGDQPHEGVEVVPDGEVDGVAQVDFLQTLDQVLHRVFDFLEDFVDVGHWL